METWDRIVAALRHAGVPLEHIDSDAIGFYTVCIDGAKEAAAEDEKKLVARFSRDALQWANQIGATPASRARLNIKTQKTQEQTNPFLQLG